METSGFHGLFMFHLKKILICLKSERRLHFKQIFEVDVSGFVSAKPSAVTLNSIVFNPAARKKDRPKGGLLIWPELFYRI